MEVMIALVMLLVIILPMSYLLGSVLNQSTNTKASVAAGLIAEQMLEESHSILSAAMTAGTSSVCTPQGGTGPDLPCTIPEANQSVQGFNYSISLYFQWTSISGTANVCKSGVIPQVVQAQVTVSWGPTLQSVSESSVINLPYIASNPTNGFLAVQVSNAAGKGSKNVLVTAATTSPSYSTTALTDSHGCAFMTVPSAAPGYSISLSAPTGGGVYVDQNDNTNPTDPSLQAVSAQGITTVALQYDQAATVDLQYPSVTGVADGITCPTTSFCLATGQQQTTSTSGSSQTNGTPTAEILATVDGTNWSPVAVPGLARALSISCTTGAPTTCEGVGTSTSGTGMAFGASITSGVWTLSTQTVPAGITELSSVSCASATSCYAVGYGVSAGTRSGVMLSYTGGTAWSKVTTSGVELIGSIACPTTATCVLTANNTATPVPAPLAYTFNTSTSAFTAVTPSSPAPSTLSQVTCGSSVSGLCVLTGTVGTNAEAWVSTNTGSTWTAVTGIPTGTSFLGTPVCTTGTSCVLTDNTPATPSGQILDLTGTPAAGPTSWAATAATLPAGIQSLSGLSCTSTVCDASGQVLSGTTGQGVLLTSTNGGSTWTSASLPGTTTPTYLSGVGCLATACVAAGESTTGDLLYGASGSTWAADTVPATADPTGTTGLLGAGWSASVGNTYYTNAYKQITTAAASATASSPNPTALSPLFPFTNGYTVWPGGCPAENNAPATVVVTPGGTATANLVLAPVTLEVVDGTGQPVPGATITLAQNNGSPCPSESFAMPTTAGDGLSRAGFSFGAYTATIVNPLDSKTTTASITINASSVATSTTTYPEPDPVVVKVS